MSIIKEGVLKYQDDTWKDVFVQIVGKELIIKKKGKNEKPITTIDLSSAASAERDDESAKPNSFVIEGKDKNYNFMCNDNNELDSWITNLQKIICEDSCIVNKKESEKAKENGEQNQTLTIDDLEILKVIGKGHFGKVQLVRNKKNNEIYAMKSMSKKEVKSDNLITRVIEERNLLISFDHPFLVSAKYALQTPTKILFLTEYVPGGELTTRIQTDIHFSIDRIRYYGAMLVSAIGYLHQKEIIHRDIKPANILIDKDGYLRLTDFGLVKTGVMSASCTGTFCGTPEYIAPEIIIGESYTKSVDWWSLGIILYQMFYGIPPYMNANVEKLYQQILNDPVEFPETMDIDEDLKDLIEKLLEKFSDQRIGGGFKDSAAIEEHPFFESIDFDKLLNKEYEMEWKPEIKDPTDISNFDQKYTNLDIGLTPETSTITRSAQELFAHFTYNNSK